MYTRSKLKDLAASRKAGDPKGTLTPLNFSNPKIMIINCVEYSHSAYGLIQASNSEYIQVFMADVLFYCQDVLVNLFSPFTFIGIFFKILQLRSRRHGVRHHEFEVPVIS